MHGVGGRWIVDDGRVTSRLGGRKDRTMKTKKTTISVDYEHNCEDWWDAARHVQSTAGGCPKKCLTLLNPGGQSSVRVSTEIAAEFVAWAEQVHGWDENPFTFLD